MLYKMILTTKLVLSEDFIFKYVHQYTFQLIMGKHLIQL